MAGTSAAAAAALLVGVMVLDRSFMSREKKALKLAILSLRAFGGQRGIKPENRLSLSGGQMNRSFHMYM